MFGKKKTEHECVKNFYIFLIIFLIDNISFGVRRYYKGASS